MNRLLDEKIRKKILRDYYLSGMIRILEIFNEVKSHGDDLNSLDFEYLIKLRIEEMSDPTLLNEFDYSITDTDFK